MKTTSEIYNVNENFRNKAKNGFVRPTVGEHFASRKAFTDVEKPGSTTLLPETNGFLDVLSRSSKVQGAMYGYSVNTLTAGKFYFEEECFSTNSPTGMGILVRNASDDLDLCVFNGYNYSNWGPYASYHLDLGDIAGMALDVDVGTAKCYENGNYVKTCTWSPGIPIKLVHFVSTNNQNLNTISAQIKAGPDFTYDIPDGYSQLNY